MSSSRIRFVTTLLEVKIILKTTTVCADWVYKGSYGLPTEETERLGVLEEMYRLAHYWDFVDSDLFSGLTRELIRLIGTRTYQNCSSFRNRPLSVYGTDHTIFVVRKLAEDLSLEDGVLAKKCEEFERMNRLVLAEGR